MSSTDVSSETSMDIPEVGSIDMKLEVVTLPVSDVDRAKRFYQCLGWRLRRRHRRRRRLPRGAGDAPSLAVLDRVREGPHHGRAWLRSALADGGIRHRRGA